VFNRLALRWAAHHGKPVVAGSDVHRIGQLGPTYTLVDAEPNAASICSAIRAGRVELRTRPMTSAAAAALITSMTLAGLRARSGGRRRPTTPPYPELARSAK
jgi:predicted metal-dependent phosphoesterase TrpH